MVYKKSARVPGKGTLAVPMEMELTDDVVFIKIKWMQYRTKSRLCPDEQMLAVICFHQCAALQKNNVTIKDVYILFMFSLSLY